jgi:hypothetical protein
MTVRIVRLFAMALRAPLRDICGMARGAEAVAGFGHALAEEF